MRVELDSTNQEANPTDWLSLQEASDMLGVAASTLRRWGDAGRVPMRRTLGGHRRFFRQAIHQLRDGQVPSASHPQPAGAVARPQSSAHGWGVDEHEMARQGWHMRLATQAPAERMRGLGQRLLGLLIQYLNRHEEDSRFLQEAHAVGANYGRETRAANARMHDTVEAFLYFRNTFTEMAMPIPGIAQPTDMDEALALQKRLNRFMDAILLGLIGGFEGEGSPG